MGSAEPIEPMPTRPLLLIVNLSYFVFCSLRIIGRPTESNDGIDHKNDHQTDMATAVSQDTQRALAQKVTVSISAYSVLY